MKENRVSEAIGKVDDRFLTEAIGYQKKKKNIYGTITKFVATAACLFLLIGLGIMGKTERKDTIVSIDINPSIELTVNKKNEVVDAKALNQDAQIVLADMELKKVDLDTALNAIVGSLLKNGYLDEAYNAINVCVENEDVARAQELGEQVKTEIDRIMTEKDLIGDVNSQSCTADEKLKAEAESYGVSVGKYLLACKVSENLDVTIEMAVKFTISELWDLLEAKDVTLITKDEAMEIALTDAAVNRDKLTSTSIKIKETAGVYLYDIKFKEETVEYKYKIDGITGSILEFEYKLVMKEEPVAPEEPEKQITKAEALNLAYADAGINPEEAKPEEIVHRPKEKEYYVEFAVGLRHYSYVINALDGSIINKESFERIPVEEIPEEVLPKVVTSIEEALKLALEAAGVNQENLTMCDIKYHVKKEGPEYKVHFHVDKTHYEYIINALTGECVEKKRPEPPIPPAEKEPKPTLIPPAEKEPKPTPVPPAEKEPKPTPIPPAEKEPKPTPIPPIEKAPKPHEVEGLKPAPVPPAQKEKPIPPHEKEAMENEVPVVKSKPGAHKLPGPKDAKVTIEIAEE